MPSKVKHKHPDKLGRELNIGDCVVYPHSNNMLIGTVVKFSPKMIIAKTIGTGWRGYEARKYSEDVVKIEGPEVSMYLLKNSG